MVKTKKEEYTRIGVTMPTLLLQKLDKHCSSIMKGRLRMRSAVISQAVTEFLSKEKRR